MQEKYTNDFATYDIFFYLWPMSLWRIFLLPFALLYGLGVWFRHLFFDWGILPSESFSVPVISVGNLSTGGSGKTPHVEYLVRLLKPHFRIAVLSRGYKRRTSGYRLADAHCGPAEIGDEALQVHKKFPDILVAVHESRRRGIRRLLNDHPETQVIILDDAFQHRYVRPGLNLLLTEYYNPFFRNFLFPVGNLRESKQRARRADALLVTKAPAVFSPLDRRFFLKQLQAYKLKKVFFSSLSYGEWKALAPGTPACKPPDIKTIFLLSGIARTEALEEHLKTQCQELFIHKYRDHHQFTTSNLHKLRKHFQRTISHSKVVVTTEKDAMRLLDADKQKILEGMPVYYVPVEVFFQGPDKEGFDQMVFKLAGHQVPPAFPGT